MLVVLCRLCVCGRRSYVDVDVNVTVDVTVNVVDLIDLIDPAGVGAWIGMLQRTPNSNSSLNLSLSLSWTWIVFEVVIEEEQSGPSS
mmetsp:Transcript_10255/g.15418  ORF Transcript_10255/g.15418 Transcript_10255/m.15418 type:complete len:87 (+) Transcript_10255:1673-1933(+)